MTLKTSLIILPIPRYRLFAHFGHFVCFSSNHQRLEIPAKQQICKVKQQGIYRYRAILRGQVDTSEGINNGTKHFMKLHSNFLVSIRSTPNVHFVSWKKHVMKNSCKREMQLRSRYFSNPAVRFFLLEVKKIRKNRQEMGLLSLSNLAIHIKKAEFSGFKA